MEIKDNKQQLVSGPLLTNDLGDFVDGIGRKITLKGINVDASAKLPFTPNIPSCFSSSDEIFWDGENVSFIGRPFPLSEARSHILRIKSWGYNIIRYVITWEALEHKGPGKYDNDFIDYTCEILKIIQDVGGIYVFIDPHQDCWSRFSGGSGAPLWTLYAAGLNPRNFKETGAAILHGDFYSSGEKKEPEVYAKMLWPSNYYKLAAMTMFTLFFSGELFAPKANINGVNIQKYLQTHFFNAFKYFLKKVESKYPTFFDAMLFGIESMNEPNRGFYGSSDFECLASDQQLRVGPTPTMQQCLEMGNGHKCIVDDYQLSIFGPRKVGQTEIDPKGVKVWLNNKDAAKWDKKYGWVRDSKWKTEECIWAQHGFWNPDTGEILKPNYFSKNPHTGKTLDMQTFTNEAFVDYFRGFKNSMRSVRDDLYVFVHPLVMQAPPRLKNTNLIDKRVIYAPHFYDGMSLMSKKWNRLYNVDTRGIVRGHYLNPVFGIVFGETNIRKCLRRQFIDIKNECKELLGDNIPIIMTETGMPFDMDNKKTLRENNYRQPTDALDAVSFALEGADISHTFWSYCCVNSHKWGDEWNCEDFSFYSSDDQSKAQITDVKQFEEEAKKKLLNDSDCDSINFEIDSNMVDNNNDVQPASPDGTRAINAIIRPYALKIYGTGIKNCEFDMKRREYKLIIENAQTCFPSSANDSGASNLCSMIYLPRHHFNLKNYEAKLIVQISSGSYTIDEELQVLKWYHDDGEQEIHVTNHNNNLTSSDSCILGTIFGFY